MQAPNPRVPPMSDAELGDAEMDVLAKVGDKNLNIMRTLVHHPKLLKRWLVFANHVLFKSSLPPRDREILILRIGWLCKAPYEFSQHVQIGKRVGMTDADIDRIKAGADAEGWTPIEAQLIQATDELHANAQLSDDTWQALAEHYTTEQVIDLVFAVGNYNLVSMALNTFGVQLDAHVPNAMG
jgi:alkylhydroperoxidase family enzyme